MNLILLPVLLLYAGIECSVLITRQCVQCFRSEPSKRISGFSTDIFIMLSISQIMPREFFRCIYLVAMSSLRLLIKHHHMASFLLATDSVRIQLLFTNNIYICPTSRLTLTQAGSFYLSPAILRPTAYPDLPLP